MGVEVVNLQTPQGPIQFFYWFVNWRQLNSSRQVVQETWGKLALPSQPS